MKYQEFKFHIENDIKANIYKGLIHFRWPHFITNKLVNIQNKTMLDATLVLYIRSIFFVFLYLKLNKLKPLYGHIIGILNFASLFKYIPRYILLLHFNTHRSMFKNEHKILQKMSGFIVQLIGVFMGIGFFNNYELHHRFMHHKYNNKIGLDMSSTEPYQRDNFFHFLIYWLRHLFLCPLELPIFGIKEKKYKTLITGMMCYIPYLYLILKFKKSKFILYFITLPFFVLSFFLMFGNWSQHIFIDPTRHRSNYGLSYNVIDSEYNSEAWNDGYHLLHHLNAGTRWYDLPQTFLDQYNELKENKGLTFKKLNFFLIGFYVFTKNYKVLYDNFLDFNDEKMSLENFTDMIKNLCKPIK